MALCGTAGVDRRPRGGHQRAWRGAALGLCASLLSVGAARAAGPVWLPPAAQATHPLSPASDDRHPAIASMGGHTYILTTRAQGGGGADAVVITTDESGRWQSTQLSTHGPRDAADDDRVALAADRGTGRLYAAWTTPNSADPATEKGATLFVATRDPATRAWSAPTAVYAGNPDDIYRVSLDPVSLVAGGGRAYVAFSGHLAGAPCATRSAGDVLLSAYDGTAWSAPQALTACTGGSGRFYAPRLALDGGRLFLVAVNSESSADWDLWYADNAGGAWSTPRQVTHHRTGTSTEGGGGQYSPYDYSIAAAGGIVYLAYTRQLSAGSSSSAIMLATRRQGGPFTARQVAGGRACTRYNVSVVARAEGLGRVGLAYIADTFCTTTLSHATLHVATGTAGHLFASAPDAALGLPAGGDCVSTALSSDPDGARHDLFHLAVACARDTTHHTPFAVYVLAETFDPGPAATIDARLTRQAAIADVAGQLRVAVRWHRGAGVLPAAGTPVFGVEVSKDGAAWMPLLTTVRAGSAVPVQHGHTYAFRVHARDRIDDNGADDWGPWATTPTLTA